MMKWTKLRASLRTRLAPCLRDRIDIHQARYRRTLEEVGRVWLTLDGKEFVSFDTSSFERRRSEIAEGIREANATRPYGTQQMEGAYVTADNEALAILRRAGESDDYRALEELEGFLSLSIAAALDSPNPLIRGVAVLDGRVGKRRLLELRKKVEHPLVRDLIELRCAAEGLGTGVRAV